jgi:hypothetical protein
MTLGEVAVVDSCTGTSTSTNPNLNAFLEINRGTTDLTQPHIDDCVHLVCWLCRIIIIILLLFIMIMIVFALEKTKSASSSF